LKTQLRIWFLLLDPSSLPTSPSSIERTLSYT
jgi:hypothetical protein